MMKILVKAYTALNLGDDLFLKILVDRYPQVQFSLISENRKGVYSRYMPFLISSFISKIVRKTLLTVDRNLGDKYSKFFIEKKIKQCSTQYDASIIIGGSVFIQNKKGYTLTDVMQMSLLSYFPHSFIIGANFGPYVEEDYLLKYKKLIENCDRVSFRDQYSYELLGRLANTAYYPDVVFQLNHRRQQIVPNSVGISVIDLSNRQTLALKVESYQNFIASIIKILLKTGKSVYLFSFCKQEGDEDAIDNIINISGITDVTVVKYNGDINAILDIYSSMEAMICSRFHAMILSLHYSQKMIPLIYSKKMSQVLDDINYTGKVIYIHEIDEADAADTIDALYSINYILLDSISSKSEEMFAGLDDFIRNPNFQQVKTQ